MKKPLASRKIDSDAAPTCPVSRRDLSLEAIDRISSRSSSTAGSVIGHASFEHDDGGSAPRKADLTHAGGNQGAGAIDSQRGNSNYHR